jgi:hypothetical protein
LQKVTAMGYLILAARKLNVAESEIKRLVEQTRSELFLVDQQIAMNAFFDFDSTQYQLEGSKL